MQRMRFIMVGGFLGAGKTTTLARLARHYMGQGRRVGLVTNDQAQDLVDTTSLRAQGFPVEEVAGACFCCRFNDLISKVELLQSAQRPDIILAEPVGSCTDLVATVAQPLMDLYSTQLQVAPYLVLFKPSHGLRILRNEADAGFSPKAAYIFRKQLEEADAILINRIDELSPAQIADLIGLLARDCPGTPVLPVSAKTGQGFDAVTELLQQDGRFGQKILDIDYDTYAEGEAELGWLNSSLRVEADEPFVLDNLLLEIVHRLRGAFAEAGAEVAHLKVIGLSEMTFGVANLVSSRVAAELSAASRALVPSAEVIVNARVAAEPKLIDEYVRQVVHEVCREQKCRAEIRSMQSFRPGRPQPTHRYDVARA
jgi:G3E family GTPase